MKEASGELNMTLITILAVAVIGGIFMALYPSIRNRISNTWDNTATDMEGAYENARSESSGTN